MISFFLYLSHVIAISGILYSYYHFFLRNKKFHGYNRFYLLCAVGISMVLPLLKIPVYLVKEQMDTTPLLHTLVSVTSANFEHEGSMPARFIETAPGFSWKVLTCILYVSGIALLLT